MGSVRDETTNLEGLFEKFCDHFCNSFMIQETVPVDTSLGQELGNLIHNSVRVKIPSKKAVLTNAGKSPPRVGRQNLIAHNVNLEWHTARLWPTDCPPGHKHKRQNSYAAAAISATRKLPSCWKSLLLIMESDSHKIVDY